MGVTEAYDRLRGHIAGAVRRDEPLARHTTFRIGGPAALLIECDTISDLAATTTVLAEEGVASVVLGKGSNVLASDEGYEGAVITLGRDFKRHALEGEHLKSGSGVMLAAVVQDTFKAGYSGLEFAVGIPGTVGGALAMNAGTRDKWIGTNVESVTLYVPGSGLTALRGPEIAWAYRRSGLQSRGIIVETCLRVTAGDEDHIRKAMEASLRRRKRTQPLSLPSAGSIFTNPPGESVGRLIDALGLKGTRIGGAQISEIHGNFIVNTGHAKASDVVALVQLIVNSVRDTHGIELKPEIRFLGSFNEA